MNRRRDQGPWTACDPATIRLVNREVAARTRILAGTNTDQRGALLDDVDITRRGSPLPVGAPLAVQRPPLAAPPFTACCSCCLQVVDGRIPGFCWPCEDGEGDWDFHCSPRRRLLVGVARRHGGGLMLTCSLVLVRPRPTPLLARPRIGHWPRRLTAREEHWLHAGLHCPRGARCPRHLSWPQPSAARVG
ncbi:hypothetical protein Dimus_010227, partial [Dionaea muscipula]